MSSDKVQSWQPMTSVQRTYYRMLFLTYKCLKNQLLVCRYSETVSFVELNKVQDEYDCLTKLLHGELVAVD